MEEQKRHKLAEKQREQAAAKMNFGDDSQAAKQRKREVYAAELREQIEAKRQLYEEASGRKVRIISIDGMVSISLMLTLPISSVLTLCWLCRFLQRQSSGVFLEIDPQVQHFLNRSHIVLLCR